MQNSAMTGIMHPDKTRYTMLIKEGITRALLFNLQQRTTDIADQHAKPTNFRKDMVGVDVDLATVLPESTWIPTLPTSSSLTL